MTTIANRILKFESMITKTIMANHTFYAVAAFSKINFFTYISLAVIQRL